MSWFVKVGSNWKPVRDHQLTAIQAFLKYQDKPITITVPHGDGGDYVLNYDRRIEVVDETTLDFLTEGGKTVTFGFFEPTRPRNGFAARMHGEFSSEGSKTRRSTPKKKSPGKSSAERLYAMYDHGYEPPHWTLAFEGDWKHRAAQTKIFVPRGADHAAVVLCASQREPVNITMEKKYNPEHDSGYTQFYNQWKTLAPNIAIYAKAMVSSKSMQLKTPKMVHVINCIGFAFDHPSQPDYQYFMKNYTPAKEQELFASLTHMFRMILRCANLNKEIENVCISFVGGAAFSTEFKAGTMFKTYLDLFVASLATAYFENPGMVINVMGNEERLHRRVLDLGIQSKSLGLIPGILNETDLFVNAWDPHSIVGNGNAADNSLDGYFGRLSDLWTLCTPDINPSMLNHIVEV